MDAKHYMTVFLSKIIDSIGFTKQNEVKLNQLEAIIRREIDAFIQALTNSPDNLVLLLKLVNTGEEIITVQTESESDNKARVNEKLKEHFLSLTIDTMTEDLILKSINIGRMNYTAGINPTWMANIYEKYLAFLNSCIEQHFHEQNKCPDESTFTSARKRVFLELMVQLLGYNKENEAEILGKNNKLKVLNNIYLTITNIAIACIDAASELELLMRCCTIFSEITGENGAWAGQIIDDKNQIRPLCSLGAISLKWLNKLNIHLAEQHPLGRGPTGSSFRSGRITIVEDVASCDQLTPWRTELATAKIRGVITLPIKINGLVRYVLSVYTKDPIINSSEIYEAYDLLARTIGFCLEGLTLRKRNQALHVNLDKIRNYDELTGLPLLGLMTELYEEKRPAWQNGSCAMMFDIDGFDKVAARFGQEYNIKAIKRVTKILETHLDDAYIIGRISEQRFLAITRSSSNIPYIIDSLIKRFNAGIKITTLPMPLKLSISFVNNNQHLGIKQLIELLDRRVEDAKHRPGNNFIACEQESQHVIDGNIATIRSLLTGITNGEVIPYLQPQIDATTHQIYGAEALCRWRRNDQIVMPGDFLPLIEETVCIVELDKHIIKTALSYLRSLFAAGHYISLSANISFATVNSEGFFDFISDCLNEVDVLPSFLTLEILEATTADEVTLMQPIINDLRALGVKIALDDFGTGSTSLVQLSKTSYDTVKIDKSIIANTLTGNTMNPATALVESIVCFSKRLGKKVIAEGVETITQRDMLLAMGCTNFQGYLYSKPISLEAFMTLLNDDDCFASLSKETSICH